MPKPTYTLSALRDLDGVRRWLDQPGSGERATSRRRDIVAALREIGDHPRRWPDNPDHPGTKDRHVHGYTIRYEFDEATGVVRIMRIFGPGQSRNPF